MSEFRIMVAFMCGQGGRVSGGGVREASGGDGNALLLYLAGYYTWVSSLCENSSCKCVHFSVRTWYLHKINVFEIISGDREVTSVTTSAQSTETKKRNREQPGQ